MITQLYIAVGLALVISALCSVFEAVLYSIPISRVEILVRSGKISGKILKRLKGDIQKPIIAILTLNTIANTMGAAVAGAAAAHVFGEQYIGWFSAIFTLMILLFSEILPKTIGVAYCRHLGGYIAVPLQWLVYILTPIIWLCESITRLVPSKKKDALLVSEQEIMTIASLSRQAGEIDQQEEQVINNILCLKNKVVRQVMTPRTVTFSLRQNMTVTEAAKLKERWDSHSRVPVYDKDRNDIIGIVLRKDVLTSIAVGKKDIRLAELILPVHFVPETVPLTKVLREFFDKRRHLFVVVDEYGGFTGVISLEDIIEEIMGREIIDESDQAKNMRKLAKQFKRRTEFLPLNGGYHHKQSTDTDEPIAED